MTTNRVERKITLRAPVARVWRALIDHREFGQWFGVGLKTPFRVGKIQRGQIAYPGFEHITWEALVEKIEPRTYFAFSWHPFAVDPKVDYSHEPRTLIEFTLKPVKGGTLFTVSESGFDNIPAGRRVRAFRMDSSGWTEQMRNIKRHVTQK